MYYGIHGGTRATMGGLLMRDGVGRIAETDSAGIALQLAADLNELEERRAQLPTAITCAELRRLLDMIEAISQGVPGVESETDSVPWEGVPGRDAKAAIRGAIKRARELVEDRG